MKKYIYIGAGGFLGAMLRFFIKTIPLQNFKEFIPINTLFINITGSFLLALITTLTLEVFKINSNLRAGICTGFLGAYTTFSTLCKESSTLIYKGYYFASISYIVDSVFLGLAFAYLGVLVARVLIKKLLNKNSLGDKIA